MLAPCMLWLATDSAVGLDAHVRVAHAWGTSCWTCSGPGWSGLAASPCLLAIEGDPHHMTPPLNNSYLTNDPSGSYKYRDQSVDRSHLAHCQPNA